MLEASLVLDGSDVELAFHLAVRALLGRDRSRSGLDFLAGGQGARGTVEVRVVHFQMGLFLLILLAGG